MPLDFLETSAVSKERKSNMQVSNEKGHKEVQNDKKTYSLKLRLL